MQLGWLIISLYNYLRLTNRHIMLKQKGQCKAAQQSLQATETTVVTALYNVVFNLSFNSKTHAGQIDK